MRFCCASCWKRWFIVLLFGWMARASAQTTPPAPANLTVSGLNSQATLSWAAWSGANGYIVRRSVSSGLETNYATTTATNYTDSGVSIGTTYYYVVCATNASGAGANSSEVSVPIAVMVTVNRTTPQGTSHYFSGFSQVDDSLDYPWTGNNGAAVTNARALMAQGIAFVNTPIMAWGPGDPWPTPGTTLTPTGSSWQSLDLQISNVISAGCVPMITLCEAPWWMKGYYTGTNTMLIPNVNGEWGSHTYTSAYTDFRGIKYAAGYVSPDPYGSRIIDSQMTNWLWLVQCVAERYMAAPYNVRYFVVWNELKGYYDPTVNHWDYNNSPGNTSGYNAQHGYTYMYNQVYQTLTNTAGSLGIAVSNLYVGGPYPVMDSGSSAGAMSNPSKVTGPWGALDQRELDVISYWLTNKVGAGFVCVDGANYNRFGTQFTNMFTLCGKFSAVNNWIRQQPGGGAVLPIVWTEWYTTNGGNEDDDFNDALGSYSVIQQLESGAMLTLLWGAQASALAEPPLWTSTSKSGGGQATPFYSSYKAFDQLFGQGTSYYPASSTSTNIAVLASQTNIMLINELSNSMPVNVENTNVILGSYEVMILNFTPWSQVQSLTLTNTTAMVTCSGLAGYPYQVQRGTNVLFTRMLRLWDTNAPASGFFGVTDDFSDLPAPPSNAFYRLIYNP